MVESKELLLKESDADMRFYIGQTQLSGTYRIDYDGSDFDGVLSFTEDQASRSKLPSNDWREGIIILNPYRKNMDLLQLFHIPKRKNKKVCGYEGRTTLVIKDFIAVKAGSESGDIATLVKIISASKPEEVFCE